MMPNLFKVTKKSQYPIGKSYQLLLNHQKSVVLKV